MILKSCDVLFIHSHTVTSRECENRRLGDVCDVRIGKYCVKTVVQIQTRKRKKRKKEEKKLAVEVRCISNATVTPYAQNKCR